jgi:hypothetical protein
VSGSGARETSSANLRRLPQDGADDEEEENPTSVIIIIIINLFSKLMLFSHHSFFPFLDYLHNIGYFLVLFIRE